MPGPILFRFLRAALAISLSVAAATVLAQPGKTIRIIVGFPAGGGTDGIARTLAERLKDELGAPVVVENRPGAGGQIAAQALKAAAADGTTYFISHDHTISILPLVVKNPGFDPTQDFVPVAGFATFVNALAVSPGTPAKNFDEYLSAIRGQGGKSAVGVPAPASVPEFVENHKAGKLRVIAVLGAARQAVLPEVPTFAELGLAGFEDAPYYAFFAPAGTPRAELDRFAAALARVIAIPEVKDKLTMWGLAVGFMPQQQLAARERAYAQTWARIIKASGYQPQ
jgi:tripartite-type tricarboxylate transporter receptor subunit TctC